MQVYDSDLKPIPIISQMQAIWEKRGLLKILVVRDLTIRYKRSIIGVWWSLLNPLFTTAVLFWVFNTVFKSRMADGTAFLPYLLSGVLLMTLFNQGLNMSADSIAGGSGIFTKIFIRPEIFAMSATISSAINFFIGLVPLTVVLLISHKLPGIQAPLVLVVALCMTLFTTGLGLLLAIAYINFDDSRNLMAIFLLALQYMTPVFYPISALGPHTRAVIQLNPLTSYAAVYRDVFGNNYQATYLNWLMMLGSAFFSFCLGFYIFQRSWPKVVAKL